MIRVVDLGFRRCRRQIEQFSDLIYENRMGSIRFSFWFGNENRMTALSGCHFKIKMTTGSSSCHFQIKWIFFKWQPDGGYHPVVILFWNDNRMGVPSGCHFILKWKPDGSAIRLLFFFKMWTGWEYHPILIFFPIWTG